MPIAERWTTRSGPHIRFLDSAPPAPAGLPILFSPGLSDFADEYVGMLELLAPRRVLAVEVRGRGGSDTPDRGYTSADHADDLRAVLDEVGVDRFHLVTFSRGTTWGLRLALAEPDRVASVSIGDYRPGEVGLPDDFAERMLATTFRGRPLGERMRRHALEQLAVDAKEQWWWDDLASLPGPMLLARAGTSEGIVTDEIVARYQAARLDLEVVVVPDAPHDLFRPDRLFYPRAVADFLARRCPGS
jgi:non-heme chloroperoxidase